MDQTRNGDNALRSALISEVRKRTEQVTLPACQDYSDLSISTREKFIPMVRGFFPRKEQSIVLDMLGRSVIFLTPATIYIAIENTPWLKTAWNLANIYLASLDVKPFTDDDQNIVGLSESTTCYVSIEYFSNKNQFDDYVIHEVAHIFHNCKRATIGLPETRRREWLLDVDFSKRETFAYACEAFSRIVELGNHRPDRINLLSELSAEPMPHDERVDTTEYVDILREAVAARNGWKSILEKVFHQSFIHKMEFKQI